ncbi:hypothetical protein CTE05_24760 [Cellulomonas terrae]|uniref:Uncharacterized protein n=1 Tax=Cellulomonas terrae TaxID=311234 RepID=A0A511JLZ1_9CELL|nr:hypothetical protein [Cellulomonas terrae]GEL98929.1 hypothetical protein CTE05_24760 [Cellulomonas terrae]
MRRRQLSGEISRGRGDRLDLGSPVIPILAKATIDDSDVARPVLGIDQDDAAGSQSHMVKICLGATWPMQIVEDGPSVSGCALDCCRDEAFALGSRRPCALVALCANEARLNLGIELTASRFLGSQLRDAASPSTGLFLCAEARLAHGCPVGWSGSHLEAMAPPAVV